MEATPEATQAFRQYLEQSADGPLVVATDGGAKYGSAAWAFAWPHAVFAGPLTGESNRPFEAELEALVRLFVTAAAAEYNYCGSPRILYVAVDCKSAMQVLERAAPPSEHFEQYLRVRRCWCSKQEHSLAIQLVWVPSHGKHPKWNPPSGLSGEQLRDLNARADAAATAALQPGVDATRLWRAREQGARAWSEQALQWARFVAETFDRFVAPNRAHLECRPVIFLVGPQKKVHWPSNFAIKFGRRDGPWKVVG